MPVVPPQLNLTLGQSFLVRESDKKLSDGYFGSTIDQRYTVWLLYSFESKQ